MSLDRLRPLQEQLDALYPADQAINIHLGYTREHRLGFNLPYVISEHLDPIEFGTEEYVAKLWELFNYKDNIPLYQVSSISPENQFKVRKAWFQSVDNYCFFLLEKVSDVQLSPEQNSVYEAIAAKEQTVLKQENFQSNNVSDSVLTNIELDNIHYEDIAYLNDYLLMHIYIAQANSKNAKCIVAAFPALFAAFQTQEIYQRHMEEVQSEANVRQRKLQVLRGMFGEFINKYNLTLYRYKLPQGAIEEGSAHITKNGDNHYRSSTLPLEDTAA